jgi:AraC-like DNA-binding protein
MSAKLSAGGHIVPIDPRQGELAERVTRLTPADGVHRTAFAPLAFIRASEIGQPLPAVYSPSVCVVIQGRKRALIGNESYHYDAFNYLIVSVTLPMLGQILDASAERPYLCLRIDIDVREVARLLTEMTAEKSDAASNKPLYVARTSADFLDVILRLVRLLDTPADLPVLAPLALREIWYRLLRGDMGSRLRGLVELEGPVQRISRAIELLQHHYDRPLRIDELADASHMSPSTFHARFKAITSMSPLQFQKQLRLHEARRLLLTESVDAGTAAHRVGYESPSQFNREYRRLFGSPPRREIARLRAG